MTKKKSEKPWTDKQKIAYAKNAMRKSFRKTRTYNETLADACEKITRVKKDGTPFEGKRNYVNRYTCAMCKTQYDRKQVEVDHKEPVGINDGTLDAYALQLFCDKSKCQVLCKDCHKIKTAKDMIKIKEHKRNLKLKDAK